MRLFGMVWSEMVRRPGPSAAALVVVAFGVAALVAVESVATSSEKRVAGQMRTLGANVLVLPAETTLQDYYAADSHGESLPEEYASRITMAQLKGVEELSPRLSVECELDESSVVLTGVLPRQEFYEQSAWQSFDLLTADIDSFETGGGLGRKHEGCCGRTCQLTTEEKRSLASYAKTRIVHELDRDSVLVGADVAEEHGFAGGETVRLLGADFRVAGVLPRTGTVDDARLLGHLHRVQEVSDSGPVVNVIEVMGCCDAMAADLVGDLKDLLPGARVVTIANLVEAQVTVNGLMKRLSYVLFAVLVVLGGASVASVMFANVSERRRELGTLMALGATPSTVGRMVILKAATLGVAGAVLGVGLGAVSAYAVGLRYLGFTVSTPPAIVLTGFGTALLVAVVASYVPARRAARLDPCTCLQEL